MSARPIRLRRWFLYIGAVHNAWWTNRLLHRTCCRVGSNIGAIARLGGLFLLQLQLADLLFQPAQFLLLLP